MVNQVDILLDSVGQGGGGYPEYSWVDEALLDIFGAGGNDRLGPGELGLALGAGLRVLEEEVVGVPLRPVIMAPFCAVEVLP